MRLAQHVGAGGRLRPHVLLRALRERVPAPRGNARALPFAARQEKCQATGEETRHIAAHAAHRRFLHLGPQREYRIDGGRARVLAPRLEFAQLFGEVGAPELPGARGEAEQMFAHALQLVDQAQRELPAAREVHRVRAAEERQYLDLDSACKKLLRQLESHRAAGAEAGDDDRCVCGPECADLGREIGGELSDSRQRLGLAVEPWRLQPEERLLLAKGAGEVAVAEHIAVVPRHAVNGRARTARLQRHDRALLLRERLGRGEEREQVGLVPPQLLPQLRRQRTRRSAAAQLASDRRELDVAAAQLREQRARAHSTSSSRSPPPGVFGAASASPSITPASAATVGCSKRFRRARLTSKRSRIWASAFIAISECAPRSNTSSSTPMASMPRSSLQIAISVFSVSLPAATAAHAGCEASRASAASAWRSTLPLAFRGSFSTSTNADGTMNWGSLSFKCSRSAVEVVSPTMKPTSDLSPDASSRAITATSWTPPRRRSASSISPSSTR